MYSYMTIFGPNVKHVISYKVTQSWVKLVKNDQVVCKFVKIEENAHISPKFIIKKMLFLQHIQERPTKRCTEIRDFKSTQSRVSKISAATYQAVYWVGHGGTKFEVPAGIICLHME